MKIITGDCRETLRKLAPGSVHCVVTSPPYWNLRDYQTANWVGGDPGCSHQLAISSADKKAPDKPNQNGKPKKGEEINRLFCRCGAARVDRQIGLESSPAAYIKTMVNVFRLVRRALRDDGTCWVNMGDSYASAAGGYDETGSRGVSSHKKISSGTMAANVKDRARTKKSGLKAKDLIGMPWRLALALQADGWYLRQDIIWAKPNPIPESVTDRCTKSHEYIFLLSKSERYYYDQEAVKEDCMPANYKTPDGWDTSSGNGGHGTFHKDGREKGHIPGNKTHKGTTAYERGDERMRTKAGLVEYASRQRSARDSFKRDDSKRAEVFPGQTVGTHRPDREESEWDTATRNKRSVWRIATTPFKEAHFATFPPALIEPCIKAGTSERGVCPHCLSPWHRSSSGWAPGCQCKTHTPIPATVLDPFGGAGTTGLVADRLGRDAVLLELNEQYVDMARNRINREAPLFEAAE